jgi:acetylglutamate kinase
MYLYCQGDAPLLFTENETNTQSLFGTPNQSPYVKDSINEYVVHGCKEAVNPEPIRLLEENGFIPVIAPVGVGESGETYNINADLVAGDVAAALFAEKLIHLTDVTGINGEDGRLVSTLTKRDAERLIKAGVIDGGMLPKVESSLRALTGGAQKAHIIDGRVPHAILLEVLTKEGIGTEIAL